LDAVKSTAIMHCTCVLKQPQRQCTNDPILTPLFSSLCNLGQRAFSYNSTATKDQCTDETPSQHLNNILNVLFQHKYLLQLCVYTFYSPIIHFLLIHCFTLKQHIAIFSFFQNSSCNFISPLRAYQHAVACIARLSYNKSVCLSATSCHAPKKLLAASYNR